MALDFADLVPDQPPELTSDTLDRAVRSTGQKYGVDPDLIHSVIHQESGGDPYAVSDQGAAGLMQLIPSTARTLGVKDVFDWRQSLDAGTRYIREGLDRYGNDPRLAAAYYHGGPDTQQWGPRTAGYAESVINHYRQRAQQQRQPLSFDDLVPKAQAPLSFDDLVPANGLTPQKSLPNMVDLEEPDDRKLTMKQSFNRAMAEGATMTPTEEEAPLPPVQHIGEAPAGAGRDLTDVITSPEAQAADIPQTQGATPTRIWEAAKEGWENSPTLLPPLMQKWLDTSPYAANRFLYGPAAKLFDAGLGAMNAGVRAAGQAAIEAGTAMGMPLLGRDVAGYIEALGMTGAPHAIRPPAEPGTGRAVVADIAAARQEVSGFKADVAGAKAAAERPLPPMPEQTALAELEERVPPRAEPPSALDQMAAEARARNEAAARAEPEIPTQPRQIATESDTTPAPIERRVQEAQGEGLVPIRDAEGNWIGYERPEAPVEPPAAEAAPVASEPAPRQRIRTLEQIQTEDGVGPRKAAQIQQEEILAVGRPITAEEVAARKAGVKPPQKIESPRRIDTPQRLEPEGAAISGEPAPEIDRVTGRRAGSWVIVDKATGKAVMETFDKGVADAVNRAKYEPIPAGEYLGDLNRRIAEQTEEPPPTVEPPEPPTAPARATPMETVPREPTRLVEFLRRPTIQFAGTPHEVTIPGGLKDVGGDLKAILGGSKGRPGLINNRTGRSLDAAAEHAWEAGYFHGDERPDVNTLLDAIRDDYEGRPRYSVHDLDRADAYNSAMERNAEIDRLAHEHDIPTTGITREQFYDRVAERMSVEDMAREMEERDQSAQDAYAAFDSAAKRWAAENPEAVTGQSPADVHGQSQARTLKDLEDEYQSEIAASEAQQRSAGYEEPGHAGRRAGAGEEGGRPVGSEFGTEGRSEAPGPAADLLGRQVAKPEVLHREGNPDQAVRINPGPATVAKMLRTHNGSIRILTAGNDVAAAEGRSLTHAQMHHVMTDQAHPAAINAAGPGEGHWFITRGRDKERYPFELEGMRVRVDDDRGRLDIPPREWPEGLRRALGVREEPSAPKDIFGLPTAGPQAPHAPEATIRTDTRQIGLPGTEPSAVQAQAARDAGRGTLRGEGPQKPPDEGLFAPDTSGQGTLYSFPGALFDPAAWRRAFGPAIRTVGDMAARSERLQRAGQILASAGEKFGDFGNTVQLMLTPMADSRASVEARAIAKDWANLNRLSLWEGNRTIDWGRKNFTLEQRRRMWDAADADSVAIQATGQPSAVGGKASLSPDERMAVEAWQDEAKRTFDLARKYGMHESEGLPSYAPRMVVDMVNGIRKRFGEGGKDARAEVVRDILNLPLATMRLRQAIAGRALINQIKDVGQRTGQLVVSEGGVPEDITAFGTNVRTTTPQLRHREYLTTEETEAAAEKKRAAMQDQEFDYFTIKGNPAFWTWRPKFVDDGNGGITTVKDGAGNTVMERVPIYVRSDFEGPLRAIMNDRPGSRMGRGADAAYRGMMGLKGRMMTSIMYGVAHLGVVVGRAFPAAPNLYRVWRNGAVAKQDPAVMRELIREGMAPIGSRMGFRDAAGMIDDPQLAAGRSWTSKLLAFVPGLFDKRAGEATKRGVDRLGDFMHNTLLWDQVQNIQVGLTLGFRDHLIDKGFDRQTATRVAANFGNIYAGALPRESMSQLATGIAHAALFSRSYRLGNFAAIKGAVAGLPRDVQAQIAQSAPALLNPAVSLAKRKMRATLINDLALYYVGNSLMQSIINAAVGLGPEQQEMPEGASFMDRMKGEFGGYARRLAEEYERVLTNPSQALNPFGVLESLTPLMDHEPNKRNRILVGYDKNGSGIYLRNPLGKFAEDIGDYFTRPFDTAKRMLSPFAKPIYAAIANDTGFGHKLYDPTADTPAEAAQGLWNFTKMVMTQPFPWAERLWASHQKQEGAGATAAQLIGGMLGISASRGYPGGEAIGEVANARAKHDFQVQQAMPAIRNKIRGGDEEGARKDMDALGLDGRYQNLIVDRTKGDRTGISPTQMKNFQEYATPEQKQRVERATRP